jgi:hypothetical protein
MDTSQTVSSHTDLSTTPITAQRVEDSRREGTLWRYFGVRLMRFEGAVYSFMRRFAADYDGGIWQFVELSNDGFYMVPGGDSFRFLVETNGYDGVLSADAAGITACLFTYSHLSFQDARDNLYADHFYRLREYAAEHDEAGQILAAID